MHNKVILFDVKPLLENGRFCGLRAYFLWAQIQYETLCSFFNLSLSQRKHRCHVKCCGIVEMHDDIFTIIVGVSLEPCPYKSFTHFHELKDWSHGVSQKWTDPEPFLITWIKDSICAEYPDILAMSARSQCTYYYFWISSRMCWRCGLITPTDGCMLDRTMKSPYERDSNCSMGFLHIYHRNSFTKCIRFHTNPIDLPHEIKKTPYRPNEVTVISLQSSTGASSLGSLQENYTNIVVIFL